jgi:toxin ParE1/3/4
MSFEPIKRSIFFRDVEKTGRYLASRNPGAADQFLDAVEHTVELLTRDPFLGHEAGFRRALGFRSFAVRGYGNFLIFYKVRGREVVFGRLVHGARDLPQLLRKRQI